MKIVHANVGTGIETLEEWMHEDTHELAEGGILIVSEPPTGFHKVYGIYAKKTGENYHFVMVVETEPEP